MRGRPQLKLELEFERKLSTHRTSVRSLAGTAALLAVVLVACTDSSGQNTPVPTDTDTGSDTTAVANGPGPVPEFKATLTQSRPDVGTPVINAELTNTGTQPVTVASVAVSSPALAKVAPSPKDTTYAPGQIIDLRTPYGRPICKSDSLTSATYDLVLDDGSEIRLPIDEHGVRWLDGLYRHDCALRALGRVARVVFSPSASRTTEGGSQYLKASLLVRRPPSSRTQTPYKISDLSGSVLLRLLPRTAGELPFTLPPGVRSARVPVLIGSFRCDAHALAASQQTYLLSVYARTPDVRTQRVTLVPPARLRARAQQLLVDVCVG